MDIAILILLILILVISILGLIGIFVLGNILIKACSVLEELREVLAEVRAIILVKTRPVGPPRPSPGLVDLPDNNLPYDVTFQEEI